MRSSFLIICSAILMYSCSTNYPHTPIETDSLSGFIESGNTLDIYSDAGLKISPDSIQMNSWPLTKLVGSLEKVMDTNLVATGSITDVYTIKIANKGQLPQREFVDSLIHQFAAQGLIE